MRFLSRRGIEEPRLDLTPMVDCVFLLLIFFMISTTFVETPGLAIKLPETSTQKMARVPREIRIYLDRQGRIFQGERPVSSDQVGALLKDLGPRAKDVTFLLLADRDARHGDVVKLMDLAQSAGVGRLAIATEQRRR